MVGHFSRVHEGEAESSAIWCGLERRQCSFGIEAVDVIKSGYVNVLSAPLQPQRAIEQHLETLLLERLGHGGGIVIAEHREPPSAHPYLAEHFGQQSSRP